MTTDATTIEFDDEGKTLAEYLAVFHRRRKPMLIAGAVVFAVAILAALFWPPTYQSSATILIEEQEIPSDMVRSTITSYANQEIQTITQRVMTIGNIMDIVKKYNLYTERELASTSRTEIAQDFQDDVDLNVINADVIDPKSGRPTQATIAFSLAFSADSPTKAQQVTNELVNLYLNENAKTRNEQARTTTQFLAQQTKDQSDALQKMSQQLAQFKRANQDALPDNYQYNVQMAGRLQSQILDIDSHIKEIEKQKIGLKSRLAQTDRYAPKVLASGETVLSDVDRLAALQSEYRKKAAIYKPDHPVLRQLRRQIDSLAASVGHEGDKNDLLRLLADRKKELVELKSKYTDDHPEVVAQERLIQELEKQVQMADDNADQATPDNPAYLVLQSQLSSAEADERLLRQQQASLKQQIANLDKALQAAPEVEKQYNAMLNNVEIARKQYADLKAKLKEAELASQLEAGNKGQRFSLIEPPQLPDEPVSPNRIAIALLGLILAGGVGVGAGMLMESLDRGLYGARALTAAAGAPPLVTVPYIETPKEIIDNQPSRKLIIAVAAATAVVVVGLLAINYFYKPLDVLWYMVLRKLGMG